MDRFPVFFYPAKFRRQCQPGRLGKTKRSLGVRLCIRLHASARRRKKIGNHSGLRMARVVDFHTLWQESLAAALASPRKDGTAVFGFHAGAKPELPFARALGWLIGAFHKSRKSVAGKRVETLAARRPLSINLPFANRLGLRQTNFGLRSALESPAMQKPHFTRREMLRAGSALALGLLPGVLRASEQRGASEFTFIVANDLHFRDERCGAWLRAITSAIHTQRPDFCVLNGDLTENGTRDQLAAVREIFGTLGVPVFATIGNHDYLTDKDRQPFEAIFPNSLNYYFSHQGWQFVGLDSTEGQRVFYTRVHEPALSWLDQTLPSLDKSKPTVLFTHFPLGSRVLCRPLNAPAVLGKFREHNLRAVFNGHWHGYAQREIGAATITNSRCCSWWRPNNDGSPDKGYFHCHAERDGSVTRKFYTLRQGSSASGQV